MRPQSHRKRYSSKASFRKQLQNELWQVSKSVGKAAWSWACTQPPVQRKIKEVEEKLEVIKGQAQKRIAEFEQEFWSWVEQLEAEGYIETPHRSGPSLATCYAKLGVTAQSSDSEVRKAWRNKMLQCHPDRFAQNPQALAEAEQQAREINQAYQIIQKIRGC